MTTSATTRPARGPSSGGGPDDARLAIAVDLLADVLARHGAHRMVAHGQSMKGAIVSGSVIHIRSVAPNEPIAFGTVVAARMDGALLVHRVVGRDARDRLLLKGDACPWPDGWIVRDDVVGIVVAVENVDDEAGPSPVSAPRPPLPRWRRALRRLQRLRRLRRTASAVAAGPT
jgi:hypothetical protein